MESQVSTSTFYFIMCDCSGNGRATDGIIKKKNECFFAGDNIARGFRASLMYLNAPSTIKQFNPLQDEDGDRRMSFKEGNGIASLSIGMITGLVRDV